MSIEFGIKINTQSDKGFSFTNVIISKIFNDRLKQSEQEAIIKLAIKSADFDEQHDRKTVEICNKVQKEVKPQIYSKIWKIGIIDRNETVKCTENKSSETISWVDRIKSNET